MIIHINRSILRPAASKVSLSWAYRTVAARNWSTTTAHTSTVLFSLRALDMFHAAKETVSSSNIAD